MAVYETLNCLGYFGFGGGFQMAKDGDRVLFCNRCPLGTLCWEQHKTRAAELFPDSVAAFEELAKVMRGAELVKTWHEHTGNADPYMVVMGGNIEDGMSVANAGRVKDRGRFTLPYPFERPQEGKQRGQDSL